MRLAAWTIESAEPVRVLPASVSLERHLEDWIERDPALVDGGLRIVARQLPLEGGRLDLLGVDPQGRWVLVEVKKGSLYRDAVVQVLDYAASIASMPSEKLREVVDAYLTRHGGEVASHPVASVLVASEEENPREIAVVVVGTGRDASLDRLVGFLGQHMTSRFRS